MPIIQTTETMRKRDKHDFYPTDYKVCLAALKLLPQGRVFDRILDAGAGTGVWGLAARYLYPQAHIVGVELRGVKPHAAYNEWFHRSYKGSRLDPVDLGIGNPPYKLAEQFVLRSLGLLAARRGVLLQLLQLNFLASQGRRTGIFAKYPPLAVYVMSRRPSFIHDWSENAGNTDATEYAIYIWDLAQSPAPPLVHWWDWQVSDGE